MSDNIPFDIQKEIIKKVSDVKSFIRFRSVSKPWKSFIDTSDFIKSYGARHTHPHSHILVYKTHHLSEEAKYIRLVDDDKNETLFKVQQQQEFAPFVLSPLVKQYSFSKVVGASHGLLCLFGYKPKCFTKRVLIIWNPCIGKSFAIAPPVACSQILPVYGFGVCPVTKDPTIVKIIHMHNKPWHVEVFTLSSGVWNVIPTSNLPRESIELNASTQVVINRFVYWSACEMDFTDEDDEARYKYMVVSFDLITKEFKVVDLPDSLTNELNGARVRVSNLRESLVVYGSIYVDGAECCGVWGMEHDSSFRKLLTIDTPVYNILGFTKSCEPIFATSKESGVSSVDVYDPCSQRIKNLGIYGLSGAFFMDSYKESLLLLNHSDSII